MGMLGKDGGAGGRVDAGQDGERPKIYFQGTNGFKPFSFQDAGARVGPD